MGQNKGSSPWFSGMGFLGVIELGGSANWRYSTFWKNYGVSIYLDLPKGAKWFLKGVNLPSLT